MPAKADHFLGQYKFACRVSGLQDLDRVLLGQAGCSVDADTVRFELERFEEEESDDELRQRGSQWIARELSRLFALTGRVHSVEEISISPSLGVTIKCALSWTHYPQMPQKHLGWSDAGVIFRTSTWEIASNADNEILRYVLLDSICESAGVRQDWGNQDDFPPRFAEVRLIRNLLAHGDEFPKSNVRKYMNFFRDRFPVDRFKGRPWHLDLALTRKAPLLSAVWKVVLRDCADPCVSLEESDPAMINPSIIYIERGPCPLVDDC
jgi:hypothetical protein